MITNKLINYVMAGVECATNQAKLGLTKEIAILPQMAYDRGIVVPNALLKNVINFLDTFGMQYIVKWNNVDLGIGVLVISKYQLPDIPTELKKPTYYYMG